MAGTASAQLTMPGQSFPSAGTPVGGSVVGQETSFFGSLFGSPATPPIPTVDSVINSQAVVAPLPTFQQDKGFFEQFLDNLSEIVGLTPEPPYQQTGWFPSLRRRNVQRNRLPWQD